MEPKKSKQKGSEFSLKQEIILAKNADKLRQFDLESLTETCRELNKGLQQDIVALLYRDACKFELYRRTLLAYQQMRAYAMLGFYENAEQCKQRFEELEMRFFEIFGKIPAYKNFTESAFINALPETGWDADKDLKSLK